MADRMKPGAGRKAQTKATGKSTAAKPREVDNFDNYSPDQIEAEKRSILKSLVANDNRLTKAMEEVATIRGERSGLMKRFRKAGGETDDARWYIATQKRKPEEVAAETRRRNQLAELMDLPLFAILGQAQNGNSVATNVDNRKIDGAQQKASGKGRKGGKTQKSAASTARTSELPGFDGTDEAERAGYQARHGETPLNANPHELGTEPFDAWARGWNKRNDEIGEEAGARLQRGRRGAVSHTTH